MYSFDLNSISSALDETSNAQSGVDFSGKSLKLDTAEDAAPIVEAINSCSNLQYLRLTGNTLGVRAAEAIAGALAEHPELTACHFSDMFTGRMKTEIPPALSALGDGMIRAGARLHALDLSDNAFGPVGVEGLAKLLQSDVCTELQELRLNNNGLGITGGRLLASALGARPRQLRVFIAGRNRLENEGAKALAAVFKSMGTLEHLSMPQNGIYHPGVSALSAAFAHNARLALIDLNDNTIGDKGAQAVAQALPKLKNLKSINFGDCLLKSKGAKTLAKAFRDNNIPLQSVNLSHNEIGRGACADLADALLPRRDQLRSVVLAGNSLGGAEQRAALRARLGRAAQLEDGDGGDDDYVTDSEEESEESEEGSDHDSEASEGSQNASYTESHRPQTPPGLITPKPAIPSVASPTSVASPNSVASPTSVASPNSVASPTSVASSKLSENNISLTNYQTQISPDSTGAQEVKCFLRSPTEENLARLGPAAADIIDTYLQSIEDPAEHIQAYAEAALLVAGLRGGRGGGRGAARALLGRLAARAARGHAAQWLVTDALLRGLALIKSEDKSYKVRWALAPCFDVLADVIAQPACPDALRDTLRFFVRSKLPGMPPALRAAVQQLPQLYS